VRLWLLTAQLWPLWLRLFLFKTQLEEQVGATLAQLHYFERNMGNIRQGETLLVWH
jgi:hypothetical protein